MVLHTSVNVILCIFPNIYFAFVSHLPGTHLLILSSLSTPTSEVHSPPPPFQITHEATEFIFFFGFHHVHVIIWNHIHLCIFTMDFNWSLLCNTEIVLYTTFFASCFPHSTCLSPHPFSQLTDLVYLSDDISLLLYFAFLWLLARLSTSFPFLRKIF